MAMSQKKNIIIKNKNCYDVSSSYRAIFNIFLIYII